MVSPLMIVMKAYFADTDKEEEDEQDEEEDEQDNEEEDEGKE